MIETIKQDLNRIFKDDQDRLTHIYGVLKTALGFAKTFKLDEKKITLAALLHDITKNEPRSVHETIIKKHFDKSVLKTYKEPFYHAFSAVGVAKDTYHIHDEDVLSAIQHHILGKPQMNDYEKILFISDYIEPNRPYQVCKDVGKTAQEDIDLAVYQAMSNALNLFKDDDPFTPSIAYHARDYYAWVCEIDPLFTTERIGARFAKNSDAPQFTAWWNDGFLMKDVGFDEGLGVRVEQLEQQFNTMMLDPKQTKILLMYDRGDHTPLGELSFGAFSAQNKSIRIGIKLCDVSRQGQGYGKEALKGFFDYLFKQYHVNIIEIDTLATNTRAIALYESLGAPITEVKKDFWTDPKGRNHDAVFFELHKQTFYGGKHDKT